MTAPTQILTRVLTFEFDPSVSAAGVPDVMEVALLPLSSATDATSGTTYAGELKTAEVELSQPVNTVSFDLVPTYSPGLSEPIQYRVMWRAGITSRTETTDFAMPDEDLTWGQLLAGPGNIINAEVYLQQADLGVPGRVARLDLDGNVVDATGTPVASSQDITSLSDSLDLEVITRAQADNTLRTNLEAELESQIDATLNTAQTYTNNQVYDLTGRLTAEIATRAAGDNALSTQMSSDVSGLQAEIDQLTGTTGNLNDALAGKANLDGSGHVPINEIPDAAFPQAIAVPNQAAMLALRPPQVYQGYLAVRPDGVYFLNGDDPSQLANWVLINIITSVNGKRGVVVLSAADVNAIPVGGTVNMNQVTGLSTALLGKTDVATTTAMQNQINQLSVVASNPLVLSFLQTGLLTDGAMPSDVAFINSSGQVTKKDGTVVSTGGPGGGTGTITSVNGYPGPVVNLSLTDVAAVGGSIAETQVTGLSTDLNNRVLTTDTRLTNARPPTAHANSHGVAGTDPVTLATSQVLGLPIILSNNALTSTSNAVNRIGSLEGRVTTLEAGGGGSGGGGSVTTTVFYDSATTGTDVTDFSQVFMHSPWGIDSDGTVTGTIGTPYYLFTGVRDADVAFPIISANGHLNLRKWNESNPADPTYALQSDLTALTTSVGNKANQSDLTALSTTVDTKANQSDLAALTTTVGTKANQSDLATTNATVATKANQSDLTALTTTVGTKANQTDMTTVQGQISTINTTLPTKADLVGGVLKASEIPTGIPQANVANLVPMVSHLNPSGQFDAAYLINLPNTPAGIPMPSITGLSTALAAKADLSGGVLAVSQIPPVALTNVAFAANRAAMLALSPTVAHQGTFCLITSTSDQGTYLLNAADPSQFSNWVLLSPPPPPVTSVNNYTGAVSLTYSDVGAMAANATMPVGNVTGLSMTLNNFLTNSVPVKHADYVATLPIASLAGPQSVDSVVMPIGAVVLATAQSSSVNNGLWVVSATAWTRPADFATGSYLAKDTIIIASNTTPSAPGSINNYTIWQETDPSGTIDTVTNRWARIGYVAPTFVPVQGNGISISGSTISAATKPGGGCTLDATGIQIDTNLVERKVILPVPASNPATVTHNLGTTRPHVSIWDTAANMLVIAGVTAPTPNTISIEFGSTPATGQYQAHVSG